MNKGWDFVPETRIVLFSSPLRGSRQDTPRNIQVSFFPEILIYLHLFNVFSEKWYGNSWKDVELALYTDTVLAWHDEVCYLSLFQINIFSNLSREERCWGAPSWSTRLT